MKRWLHWVRLSLGITLVALLVTHFAGMHATWSAVLSAHPLPLAGCVAIYFVGVVLSCLKWQWLLRAQGIQSTADPFGAMVPDGEHWLARFCLPISAAIWGAGMRLRVRWAMARLCGRASLWNGSPG
ncbi:MAG: hypothetical protein RMJ48_07540 [Roseiflexaceae bacterium]|nr:hypothetical protein [Roseiflexaceae bacterium]